MKNCAVCLWLAACMILCLFIGAAVQAQLAPPPPAINATDSSFTEKDRLILNNVYRMVRSIRTKLFPLDEERRILDMER